MPADQQIEDALNSSLLPSDEISFSAIFGALRRGKKRFVKPVLWTALAATATAFLIPVKYTAEAVILTPQQSQPSLSAMAQLAGGGAGLVRQPRQNPSP